MFQRREGIDLVTLSDKLRHNGGLEAVGGDGRHPGQPPRHHREQRQQQHEIDHAQQRRAQQPPQDRLEHAVRRRGQGFSPRPRCAHVRGWPGTARRARVPAPVAG